MTLKEIFVLNRALDGKDVYSLPPFKELHMSEVLSDAVKDSLIEHGLLESYDEFTMDGIRITKRILDFKNAPKYVHIDDMVIGLLDDNLGIMLQKDYFDETYNFTLIDVSDSTSQILKSYDFLREKYPEQPLEEVQFDYDSLAENFEIEDTNSMRIVTLNSANKREKTDEIIFSSDNQLYLYDYAKKMLYSKNPNEITEVLRERMAV